ncbi:hypothetical protein FD723_40090 (plasmid) [Nostoc sp. C052]|uniref:hypothetical protein n=1 Tax=Nostoc sp. C052 TaxID=2576902 RepID=UPI0015C3D655|nr:hypothetical protein [Nostoc sp. C052]QLE46415.1 hypothetical protein FD723_40090 [Nostoc sp. C052]
MEFTVLKFDSYPSAIAWLDENPGIAVRGEDSLFSLPNSPTSLHIIFSELMSNADILKILEWFPSAQQVNCIREELGMTPREDRHSMYLLHGWTRHEVVEVLKKLGATVKKSACCMEFIENEEIFSRLQELETRLGKPLSQAKPSEMGDLYRKLYP